MNRLKNNKSLISTLGLILITIWSAVQFLFYNNVPEDTSTFAFVCITNLVGCVILCLFQRKNLRHVGRGTVKKALLFSVVQIFINFFIILGSRNVDPVLISGVMGLYFIFVTPMLLMLRKKVSFRSGVATVVALLALLLVYNADIDGLLASPNVVFLLVADLLFAGYVVMVSFMADSESPQTLAVIQMAGCAALSFVAWVIEAKLFGHGTMTLSTEPSFWISVLFIGVFIRALYSVIQFAAQKNVPPVNTSLIFASEIVITLILNPLLCRLFGTSYEKATVFQIVGCVLFVLSILICDDDFMKRFKYDDMDTTVVRDKNGNELQQVPLSRRIVNLNLIIGLGALILSTLVCLLSIYAIRNSVINTSRTFGLEASSASEQALIQETERELVQRVNDKASLAGERLNSYSSAARWVSAASTQLLCNPDSFKKSPVSFPYMENSGIWTMQMTLADDSITYDDIRSENEALGNLESLFASIQSSFPELLCIYVGTGDGLLISYDTASDAAGVSGTPFYYEYRGSDWYTAASELGAVGFTDAYRDASGRGLTITCFSPIYDSDGSYLGAVGMDLLQNKLNDQLVNVGVSYPETAVLVSAGGTVIASTSTEGGVDGAVNINDDSSGLPLTGLADSILSDDGGLLVTNDEQEPCYVAFSRVESTGWRLCILSPLDNIIAPTVEITNNIENSTEKIANTVNEGIRTIIANCLIIFAVIVLIITYLVGRLSASITEPLKQLERDAFEISEGNLNQRTSVDTRDEIGSLARAFNDMTDNLQHYIKDLTEATAKDERISSELSLARKIQTDALPSEYPAFHNRKEFDLFCTMKPAAEIGGDFYDYFMIDDSHLALMICDVSGKGVPAALFMMACKMIVKNRAMVGGTPSEILEFANKQLCENNMVEMFVTVWLGIIDLKTGILTASNAGHKFPVMKHGDGLFELFRDKHGLVLAVFEDSSYSSYTVQLSPGDMLFVYTDGLPEATNESNAMFGTERMLAALNSCPGSDCRETVETLLKSVEAFMSGASQLDDITMLCMRLDKLME